MSIVSDSCSSGQAVDSSGINLKETIESDKLIQNHIFSFLIPSFNNALYLIDFIRLVPMRSSQTTSMQSKY